ncbi:DUF899 domain-containing protein [Alteribacter natronophilus]|nr:DUF899 domain-containing protein [Alteribacter natronophilus]
MTMHTKELTEQITRLEREIQQKKNELAQLRRTQPQKEVENAAFLTHQNERVTLEDLFEDKNELILIHHMGKRCSYCSLWSDGFNGIYPHLSQKAAFAVATPDPPDTLDSLRAERGWTFPLVSDGDTPLRSDLGFQVDDLFYPGVSVFQKTGDGRIVHTNQAMFGPGDDFCSVWHLLDLLPGGRSDFDPAKTHGELHMTGNVAVQIREPENAARFYEHVLGMTLIQDKPGEIVFQSGSTTFYMEKKEGDAVYFEFAAADTGKMKQRLVENGCEIEKTYSDTSMLVKDPYGLRFHLFEK